NATQKNVTGPKNWAAVRDATAFATVEVTTGPKNNADEWKQIQWSSQSGDAVLGNPNRRKISLATSAKYHVEAKLGTTSDYVDLWVLWGSLEIRTSGKRPPHAAPFDANTRDGTDQLGAVTYTSLSSSVIDARAGVFVDNMGASGKIAVVATLTPKGVSQ